MSDWLPGLFFFTIFGLILLSWATRGRTYVVFGVTFTVPDGGSDGDGGDGGGDGGGGD